jgi:hypothetical protein
MISFRRTTVFFFGLIIILLLCYSWRINFYLRGKITSGTVLTTTYSNIRRTTYTYPTVKFLVGDDAYTFRADSNLPYDENDKVSVIYNPNDPRQCWIFTFLGFWLTPLIYSILPVVLLTAATFSFWSADDLITIGRKKT